MLRHAGLFVFVLAAGCATTETPVGSDASAPRAVRTYALEVSCEHCVKSSLETSIAAMVRASIPCAVRVPQVAGSDLIIQYSEGDSVICIDCEYDDELRREWWWRIDLYATRVKYEQTLFGSVDKLFGRPGHFAGWQFRKYVARQPWSCPP